MTVLARAAAEYEQCFDIQDTRYTVQLRVMLSLYLIPFNDAALLCVDVLVGWLCRRMRRVR